MQKRLALLGAGPEQLSAIQEAKKLDLRVIVLDSNPLAVGIKFADEFIKCDITSAEEVVTAIKPLNVDGIMVHAIELAAVVADAAGILGLPAVNSQAAYNATNKIKRIEILSKNKIPCARFGSASNIGEAMSVSKDIGYPVVIKPPDNAGSRGVTLIEDQIQLEKYFTEAQKYCKKDKRVLIEEYLSGFQISTETVVYQGKMYTTGFSDRNYADLERCKPYFIEDGGDMPTILQPSDKNRVIAMAERAIAALGIDFGAAKGDLLLHDDEVYVIEMAARTSGGRFASHQVPAATGVNILSPIIKMTVSDPVDPVEFKPKFNIGCSKRYVIPNPGKVISITGIDEARRIKGVFEIIISDDLVLGATIKRATDNSMRKGVVMAIGDTREEAIERATTARDLIRVETIS